MKDYPNGTDWGSNRIFWLVIYYGVQLECILWCMVQLKNECCASTSHCCRLVLMTFRNLYLLNAHSDESKWNRALGESICPFVGYVLYVRARQWRTGIWILFSVSKYSAVNLRLCKCDWIMTVWISISVWGTKLFRVLELNLVGIQWQKRSLLNIPENDIHLIAAAW